MADEDIYRSKAAYVWLRNNLDTLLESSPKKNPQLRYTCTLPSNLRHFEKLIRHFEASDISYIRRLRVLDTMKFVAHHVKKDLGKCDRDDINELLSRMHQTNVSPHSKETFIKNLKYIWKVLFPEMDEIGRPDDTVVPYPVRHVRVGSDVSRQKLRKDRFTWEEFQQLIDYFGKEPRIQSFLTLSLESLARPQELLFLKVGDVELHDTYARISLSEHGKEGVGLLQCIDSYPYVLRWLNEHPSKNDKGAFLFVNLGNTNTLKQLKPQNINKMVRKACKDLGISKPITCYSLKRNGVTLRRLRGESDVEIQHAARWRSGRQLKTYDMTTQDDAFRIALEKRGLLERAQHTEEGRAKKCLFCEELSGFGEIACLKCKRPFSRSEAVKEANEFGEMDELKIQVRELTKQLASIKEVFLPIAEEQIRSRASGNTVYLPKTSTG